MLSLYVILESHSFIHKGKITDCATGKVIREFDKITEEEGDDEKETDN